METSDAGVGPTQGLLTAMECEHQFILLDSSCNSASIFVSQDRFRLLQHQNLLATPDRAKNGLVALCKAPDFSSIDLLVNIYPKDSSSEAILCHPHLLNELELPLWNSQVYLSATSYIPSLLSAIIIISPTNANQQSNLNLDSIDVLSAIKQSTSFLRSGMKLKVNLMNNSNEMDLYDLIVEHCEPFFQGLISEDIEIHAIYSDQNNEYQFVNQSIEPNVSSLDDILNLSAYKKSSRNELKQYIVKPLPTQLRKHLIRPHFFNTSLSLNFKSKLVDENKYNVKDYYLESNTLSLKDSYMNNEEFLFHCTNADSTLWCSQKFFEKETNFNVGSIVRLSIINKSLDDVHSSRLVRLALIPQFFDNLENEVFVSNTLFYNLEQYLIVSGIFFNNISITLNIPGFYKSFEIPFVDSLPIIKELKLSKIADPNISNHIYDEALEILKKMLIPTNNSSHNVNKSLCFKQNDLIAVIVDNLKIEQTNIITIHNNDDKANFVDWKNHLNKQNLCSSSKYRTIVYFHVDVCESTKILNSSFDSPRKLKLAKLINENMPLDAYYNYGFFDIKSSRLILEGSYVASYLPKHYRNWYLNGNLDNYDSEYIKVIDKCTEQTKIKNSLKIATDNWKNNNKSPSSITNKLLIESKQGSCINETLNILCDELGILSYKFSLLDIWNSKNGTKENAELNQDLLSFKINDIILKSNFKGIVIIEGFEIFSDKSNDEPNSSPDGSDHTRDFLLQVKKSIDSLLQRNNDFLFDSVKENQLHVTSILNNDKAESNNRNNENNNSQNGIFVLCLTNTMENVPHNLVNYFPNKIKLPEFLSIDMRESILESIFDISKKQLFPIDYSTLSSINSNVNNGTDSNNLKFFNSSIFLSPDISINEISMHTAGLSQQNIYDVLELSVKTCIQRINSLLYDYDINFNTKQFPFNYGAVLICDDIMTSIDIIRKGASDAIGAPKIPKVYWNDIGGMENVKSSIIDTIQLPMKHPELFSGNSTKRSGILLYGPPGTGKTLVAKAVATEFGMNFLSVKGPELLNMYIGESEANVRKIFEKAKACKPCIIFFDELDSIAPRRGDKGDSGGVMDRIVSQLLAEMDEINSSTSKKSKHKNKESQNESKINEIFIIGASNRPDLLDQSLLRPGRFDSLLYLGVSDSKEKQISIMKALCRKMKLDKDVNFDNLNIPNNLTGADFYAICSDALLIACNRIVGDIEIKREEVNAILKKKNKSLLTIDEVIDNYFVDKSSNRPIKEKEQLVIVTMEDFEKALENLVPSVSSEELLRYEKIRDSIQNDKNKDKGLQNENNNDVLESPTRSKNKGKGKGRV